MGEMSVGGPIDGETVSEGKWRSTKYNDNFPQFYIQLYPIGLHTTNYVWHDIRVFFMNERARAAATSVRIIISVTRLGDLLDFGQLFKAFGNN